MSVLSIVGIVISVILLIGIVRVLVKEKKDIDNLFLEILLLDLIFEFILAILEGLD